MFSFFLTVDRCEEPVSCLLSEEARTDKSGNAGSVDRPPGCDGIFNIGIKLTTKPNFFKFLHLNRQKQLLFRPINNMSTPATFSKSGVVRKESFFGRIMIYIFLNNSFSMNAMVIKNRLDYIA